LNPGKKIALSFLLTAVSVFSVSAQANKTSAISDTTVLPQWVKDLRRWEIVAFGSIPFTMLTASFAMDMYRWNNANGMDFSDEGRKYAPWPLKSAGAAVMKSQEQEMVFIMAASLSVTIAMADQVIVQIKRYKARKRAEALPVGTTIITKKSWPEEMSEAQDGAEIDEAVPITTEPPSPEQP